MIRRLLLLKLINFRGSTHKYSSNSGSVPEDLVNLTPIKMSYSSYESTSVEGGKGAPPIIVMHGLFGSKSNWNSLSKAMHNLTTRKIIAVDARNHGESPHTDEFSYHHLMADINYLVSELGIPKVSLLGHSMGGRAVMLFALTHPDKVEKLIVVDISPLQSSSQMYSMDLYFDALRSVSIDPNLSLSVGRKEADTQLSQRIPDPDIRQFLLTNLTKVDGGNFQWRINLESLSRNFEGHITQFPQTLGSCEKPTLFIGGLKSDYLKKAHHGQISKIFPNAEFRYVNAGHWVHAEKPNEFLQLVGDFIGKQ